MPINIYQIKLNKSRVPELIKERSVDYEESNIIDDSESAVKLFEELFDLSNQAQEVTCLLALNGCRRVVGAFEVCRGTATVSMAHPREIYQRAILVGAVSIILAHSHPSGLTVISEEDQRATKKIISAGNVLSIPLDDFLICAGGKFISTMHLKIDSDDHRPCKKMQGKSRLII